MNLSRAKTYALPFLWLVVIGLVYIQKPFAINLEGDVGTELLNIVRLIDGHFSFSANPSAAYANPVVQMLTSIHGPTRLLVYFPIFFIVDYLGVTFNELSVGIVFVTAGLLFAFINYCLLRGLVGARKAFVWLVLLTVSPHFVMQLKMGAYPQLDLLLFITGLSLFVKALHSDNRRAYVWFCVVLALYVITTAGFTFGIMGFGIYAMVFLYYTQTDWRTRMHSLWRATCQWPTAIPVAALLFSISVTTIGALKYGSGFGVLSQIIEKNDSVRPNLLEAIRNFVPTSFALFGYALWGLIIVSVMWFIISRRYRGNVLMSAMVWYFIASTAVVFLLLRGSVAYTYPLYVPGLLLVAEFLTSLKRRFLTGFFCVFITTVTLVQTLLYQYDYPTSQRYYSMCSGGANKYRGWWCPWHFHTPKNIGIKTAGYILRYELGYEPLPFVSIKENFYTRPQEIFFFSAFQETPTIHLGRRIVYRLDDLQHPNIVLVLDRDLVAREPYLADPPTNEAVLKFLEHRPEYRHIAMVTQDGSPQIHIFERDSLRAYAVYPVEEYDVRFDEQYGNLRAIGHIDLG